MSHFHRNLGFLMRNRNETQDSVAEFVGVSQAAVSHWLHDTMPRAETVEKIAQFFTVTVEDLVNHELPHRTKIEALTELERELKTLRDSWGSVAKGLKERAAKLAAEGGYSSAAQNDWLASATESCANDLSKVLEAYFPDDNRATKVEHQPESDVSPAGK